MIWVKRFRGGIIGDLARGSVFHQNYDFASVGFKLLADFCMFRLNYNITAGFTIAKGLKKNGLDELERSLTLALPF